MSEDGKETLTLDSPTKPASLAVRLLTALYLVAAAGLLVWGAWKRFQLPQYPIIDPDIEGYLGPAISALAGKPFLHLTGRSFPYPAFVYLTLRVFGDFRAIAVIQHLLGVAAGMLVLFAWNAAGALIPSAKIPKAIYRFLGFAPAYVYLGSATAISFEHQIRPEAVFSFLAILNIWISLLFIERRFLRQASAFVWLGAGNVFLACLIYLAKPSFGFAVVFSTLPVWLSLFWPGPPARQRAWMAAAAILPALLLLFLPEHILKSRDKWGGLFLPETLICVHASIVSQQMAEDLSSNDPLPYPKETIQAASELLSAELDKASRVTSPKTYPSLGYNPDYLMYEDSFCIRFQQAMHWTNDEMAQFCMTYYRRALLRHPGLMVAKTKKQLALFYSAKNPAYWLGKSLDLSGLQYARVARIIPLTAQLGPGYPPLERYVQASNPLALQGIAIPQTRSFVEKLRLLSAHYLDLLVVALLSPLLLLVRPLRYHFLWLVGALWLVYSYNFGNCLTIAVVHSLEVTRYVRIQLIFTVFAQSLSLYLILELVAMGLHAGLVRFMPQWASRWLR